MRNRLLDAQQVLENKCADFLLITDSQEGRYFSGFRSSNMVLLWSPKQAFLISDFRYREAAEKHCAQTAWTYREVLTSFADILRDLIPSGSRVLVQSNRMILDEYMHLKNSLSAVQLCEAGEEITALFMIKTESEINSIREASAISDRALSLWYSALKRDVSEFDAARLLEKLCLDCGSGGTAFDTIVLFGERTSLPHGAPSRDRFLCDGDFILCDFGCTVEGFCSDMTRTCCFGHAQPEQRAIYDAVLSAQEKGRNTIRAGMRACEVDSVVRDSIESKMLGEYFGHGTGHALGLRIHELPALNRRDTTVLAPGMVVTIEPGLYIPQNVGVRIEDTVLITETGCDILTSSDRAFIELL